MKIYLFRHAEKDQIDFNSNSQASGYDPGLTQRGHEQSIKLAQLVVEKELLPPTQIFTSQKKRALQTLQPLAQSHSLEINQIVELNERKNSETSTQFISRINNFVEKMTNLQSPQNIIYCCSHYDWIEEFLYLDIFNKNLSSFSGWAPASYMLFEIQKDVWHMKEFKRIII